MKLLTLEGLVQWSPYVPFVPRHLCFLQSGNKTETLFSCSNNFLKAKNQLESHFHFACWGGWYSNKRPTSTPIISSYNECVEIESYKLLTQTHARLYEVRARCFVYFYKFWIHAISFAKKMWKICTRARPGSCVCSVHEVHKIIFDTSSCKSIN